MNIEEKVLDQNSIQDRIEPLLEKIADKKEKKATKEFWYKHSIEYFDLLNSIDVSIQEGKVAPESVWDKVIKATDEVLLEGDKLEGILNGKRTIRRVKRLFREVGLLWGSKSKIVAHAFLKPSGYPGDYGLLEIIYDNMTLSEGFGYCADKTFLEDSYARAVRSRKDKMKKILGEFMKNCQSPADILSIACGSSREVREMFSENEFDGSKKIRFTLMDRDQEALNFSKKILKDSPGNVKYKYMNHNVYDYVDQPEEYYKIIGKKDLIYTTGLADYLRPGTLKGLISFGYNLLKPGGKLVIAHKDSKNYKPLTPDWFCDWRFHLRDEPEVVDIVKSSGIKDFSLKIDRESVTNIIFFLIIEKNS